MQEEELLTCTLDPSTEAVRPPTASAPCPVPDARWHMVENLHIGVEPGRLNGGIAREAGQMPLSP